MTLGSKFWPVNDAVNAAYHYDVLTKDMDVVYDTKKGTKSLNRLDDTYDYLDTHSSCWRI
jgi:hypothetical protein